MTQEKKIVNKLVLGPPAAIFVIFDPSWNQGVPPVKKKFLEIDEKSARAHHFFRRPATLNELLNPTGLRKLQYL